jgi:hypothetical protein
MTDPTGLDYQAAYQALYPGLSATVRIQDLPDDRLKQIDRAARLRRTERERVKEAVLALAVKWEADALPGDPMDTAATELRMTIEEIR